MSEEEKKFAYISWVIAGYIQDGMKVDKAIDMVLGQGTYKRLVDEVYDEQNQREVVHQLLFAGDHSTDEC